MKTLLFIFSFIMFGFQTTFFQNHNSSSLSQIESKVIDTDDVCSCCTREWMSQDINGKTHYQVKFTNHCSTTVTISYKFRSDNGKLVQSYAQVGAGKTSAWYPAGYEKQLYSYSEE